MEASQMHRVAFFTALLLYSTLAGAGSEEGELTVKFIGLKSTAGTVMVALYNSKAAYDQSSAADSSLRAASLKIDSNAAAATFERLIPGVYAVKAFHDLNGNSKLDFNSFGAPTEPVAFSNDAPVQMRAPSWQEAVFTVAAGKNSIVIHLN
jgi:uncharacterized protein (DUF2141 family)